MSKEKIAKIIATFIKMICKTKDKINFNSQEVKNKINRSKDKERQQITTTLGDMTKEQREVENIFKNHRLERWNKGLQKGLTQYDRDTYDDERAQRENDEIIENRLMMAQSTLANREIDTFEDSERAIVEERIDKDVNSLSGLPDDDEYAEEVDDSYTLQYDDNDD